MKAANTVKDDVIKEIIATNASILAANKELMEMLLLKKNGESKNGYRQLG